MVAMPPKPEALVTPPGRMVGPVDPMLKGSVNSGWPLYVTLAVHVPGVLAGGLPAILSRAFQKHVLAAVDNEPQLALAAAYSCPDGV
jgi:hypothetical protein